MRKSIYLLRGTKQALKGLGITLSIVLFSSQLNSQNWVDTLYHFTQSTVSYGSSSDFAGNLRELKMDVCVPSDDVPPSCGRPLLIAIHGGAFMAGNRKDATPQQWMKDFAKRGYVTASIEYRLGLFQTPYEVHCNVTQIFNVPWDCLNAADTSEWVRAVYRGIQDTKGAIRYFLNNNSLYNVDPNNIYLAGESAGGFIALNTAFASEQFKPAETAALPNALPPNAVYNTTCIQGFGLDTSIASLKLARPDLGPNAGQLNPGPSFKIKAVANFYGALLPMTLEAADWTSAPKGVYMYHQPNDLVVPFGFTRAYDGFSNCFTALGCANIINRPWVLGSSGIMLRLNQLKSAGVPVPDFKLDATNNYTDCLGQVLNPALGGHSIDNYSLRTENMAKYFAPFVSCTSPTFTPDGVGENGLSISPNPLQGTKLSLRFIAPGAGTYQIQLMDSYGRLIQDLPVQLEAGNQQQELTLPASAGIYCVRVQGAQVRYAKLVFKI